MYKRVQIFLRVVPIWLSIGYALLSEVLNPRSKKPCLRLHVEAEELLGAALETALEVGNDADVGPNVPIK